MTNIATEKRALLETMDRLDEEAADARDAGDLTQSSALMLERERVWDRFIALGAAAL